MRVEVEIGAIEIDALPEGVSVEGLRAAVAGVLEAQVRACAIPGTALPDSDRGEAVRLEAGEAGGLRNQIAAGIHDELVR